MHLFSMGSKAWNQTLTFGKSIKKCFKKWICFQSDDSNEECLETNREKQNDDENFLQSNVLSKNSFQGIGATNRQSLNTGNHIVHLSDVLIPLFFGTKQNAATSLHEISNCDESPHSIHSQPCPRLKFFHKICTVVFPNKQLRNAHKAAQFHQHSSHHKIFELLERSSRSLSCQDPSRLFRRHYKSKRPNCRPGYLHLNASETSPFSA